MRERNGVWEINVLVYIFNVAAAAAALLAGLVLPATSCNSAATHQPHFRTNELSPLIKSLA